MIVSELIDKLKEMPQDALVVGRGYESGWEKIEDVEYSLLIECDAPPWEGTYQDLSSAKHWTTLASPVDTVTLH